MNSIPQLPTITNSQLPNMSLPSLNNTPKATPRETKLGTESNSLPTNQPSGAISEDQNVVSLPNSIEDVKDNIGQEEAVEFVPNENISPEERKKQETLSKYIEQYLKSRSTVVNRNNAPSQVLCYLCCAEFGTASLLIHQKTCWSKQ